MMDDSISVSPAINSDNFPIVAPLNADGVNSLTVKVSENHTASHERNVEEAPFATTEILTRTDIEIRKLHALRRAKEYYEQQLAREAERALSVASLDVRENESSVSLEYSARVGGSAISRSNIPFENADGNCKNGLSFKTDAAISGYKTYKKETPKAWEVGDMDEKR